MRALLHEDNINPVYIPFFQTTKRYVNLRGGAGSSKSYTTAQKLLSILLNPYGHKEKVLALRKVGTTLRHSVFALFKEIIHAYNLDVQYKSSTMSFHAPNGNEIILAGLDDSEKIKSVAGITKIWLEEATEFTEEDFDQLDLRIRGHVDSFYQIILTFNPIHERHWIKRKFWDTPEEGGEYDPEMMFNLVTTYRDNKFLDEQYKQKLEKLINSNINLYRVYVKGEWGIEQNDNMWLYAFSNEKHVKPSIPFLPTYDVYLSFDFNKDPLTCLAIQMSPNKGDHHSFVHIIKEFGGKKSLEDLCAEIKMFFPGSILYVTGDSSGNTEGVVGYQSIHDSAYTLIRSYLDIQPKQLHPITSNLHYENSRLLMNQMFAHYPNLFISAEGCPNFINDCVIATIDEKSNKPHTLKKDRDLYKMDYFDGGRYFFQRYFHDFAKTNYFNIKGKIPA